MNESMQLVLIYSGFQLLIGFVLAVNAVKYRFKTEILLGDGGNTEMLKAMRSHGNWSEYSPAYIISLLLISLVQGPSWLIHTIGIISFVGRASHAYGLSQKQDPNIFRQVGFVLSILAMLICVVSLIYLGYTL
jgi:uncharacterized protein